MCKNGQRSLAADQRLDRGVGAVAGPADAFLADREQTPLKEVCAAVTNEVEIRLEYEAAYEWLAFVPRRNGDPGALTKYFGRSADGGYKYRGIECHQRSTCEFVADTLGGVHRNFRRVPRPRAGP